MSRGEHRPMRGVPTVLSIGAGLLMWLVLATWLIWPSGQTPDNQRSDAQHEETTR